MNGYDYCNSCGKLFDYLDLKPYRMRWYCKSCYKEMLRSTAQEPLAVQAKMLRLYSYDYCSKCGKLFDYLEMKPYNLKWYCNKCYNEVRVKVLETK
ncbi:MAG: hypothetical protein KatS3mg003_0851 [Candidatus Nitrosocaldaceae archaeon]|nr:MAG: hypothetical protein KatS3mg003_0851 [Candidatus Nitrosocaldaceae archaeon]